MTETTEQVAAGRRPAFHGAAERFATLDEIITAGRSALPGDVLDFLDGGAGAEVTLEANRTAFDRWIFRPRVMSGRERPSTATTFLGIPLSLPVLSSPFGADGLFHPDGQVAVARANAAEGTVSIVPEAGTHSLERVAAEAPAAAKIAQLHPMGPRENFLAMLRRIEDAGYQAVCLTLDCPTGGWRERNLRNRFDLDPAVITGNYPAGGDVAPEDVFGQLFTRTTRVWSWEELAGLMRRTSLPWVAKGILTAEDAHAAVRAGASGVLVSNHGGRQLDGAPAALDQLPEVVDAVGGQVEIALDSGVRRGTDVVKALALGANVVVIGRLAAYGLAAGGEAGVRGVYRLLRAEVETVLTLLGRGGVGDLGSEAVRRSAS